MGSNAEVIQKAYTAFASGDIAGILDLVDEHVEWSAPGTLPQGGTFTGKSGAVKFFEGLGPSWESLKGMPEALGDAAGTNLVVPGGPPAPRSRARGRCP